MAKLIGTAPNQVPTNADLGSLAYMDKDNFDANISELTLGALSREITDTAVDIFVYDTSKDSDGGAWRKRTQHTSWYNETLNTSTRGSRKEFPAVAVIVADAVADTVTIYDGDDPDLPMWMVFTAKEYASAGPMFTFWGSSATGNVACVSALNGIVSCGINGGSSSGQYTGLARANFISDDGSGVRNYSSQNIYYPLPISERNLSNYTSYGVVSTGNSLVGGDVNDVAMTVLPNAPIDAATGLPVPTIAVATDGGVSVIKDDGTVVDIKLNSGSWTVTHDVEFYGDTHVVFGTWTGSEKHIGWRVAIPSSDVSYNEWEIDAGGYSRVFTGRYNANSVVPVPVNNDGWRHQKGFDKDIVLGGDSGLTKYNYDSIQDHRKNLFNYITSDYNTGWMNGDIKLATLSDTDDTDVTGSELVTNGTFDTDIDDWQARGNASNSWNSSGYIDLDRNGETADAGRNVAYQVISGFTVGATYTASAEVIALSNGFTLTASLPTLGSNIVEEGAEITAVGIATVTFVATATTLALGLGARGSQNATATVDNISVRLAEEDRSVNGNGLQVFGTVTKNPVATGADLVAYSGFSTSNYLQQPYNADLDIGTGDVGITLWFRKASTSVGEFYHRSDGGVGTWGSSEIIQLENGAGGYFNAGIYTSGFANSANAIQLTSSEWGSYCNDTWHCMTFVRRNGVIELYINGVSLQSSTMATNVSGGSPKSWIGERPNVSRPLTDGDIALFRISATAPSPEQIKKIYEDEKVLFQENAQATLYGSSDAVTALAYDDSTELLHVGTSAGRSVFQGLRRVDNTTTAVGAAISASNGLVADE